MSSEILLSIAIPTFNRAKYLDRCLSFIHSQLKGKQLPVEVIVSDNCSTDNTFQIIEKYRLKNQDIKYYKNDQNYGMDFNILQCYTKSAGKYVVAFSDDDIFLIGSIEKIIKIIQSGEFGVIYMLPTHIKLNSNIVMDKFQIKDSKIITEISTDKYSFINSVNHHISFISGNIINRTFVKETVLEKYIGSFLIHVPLILTAIHNSTQNIFIRSHLIAMQDENSGGYDIFNIFGVELPRILSEFDKKASKIIINHLLTGSFPSFIYYLQSKRHNYIMEPAFGKLLKETYHNSIYYKIFLAPMLLLPIKISRVYLILIKLFNILKNGLLNIYYSNGVISKIF